ncbi:TetR family transcriptional regulator [Kutzneria sp. NPDC051319]|uniref:acyl-CoA-like ligand-binding transcription factor n=1 Tax=Kutzneria sp. NPDC051319 TaxID=3155047 RepID=UPI00343B1568
MTGLRERKKRETRLALSRAAIGLLVARGWDGVTVEEIAAAANVSDRTFRNYFSSKAEAVAASHLERALVVADELRSRPAEDPFWPAVRAAVRSSVTGAAVSTHDTAPASPHSAAPASPRDVPRASPSDAVSASPSKTEPASGSSADAASISPHGTAPASTQSAATAPARDGAYMERVKLVLSHPSLHAELLRADDMAKDELAAAIAERLGLDRERDLFPQLAASVVAAGVATAMRFWMVNDPQGSVIDVMDRVFEEIGRGLPVPEGES